MHSDDFDVHVEQEDVSSCRSGRRALMVSRKALKRTKRFLATKLVVANTFQSCLAEHEHMSANSGIGVVVCSTVSRARRPPNRQLFFRN
jgi:hypothetical protein